MMKNFDGQNVKRSAHFNTNKLNIVDKNSIQQLIKKQRGKLEQITNNDIYNKQILFLSNNQKGNNLKSKVLKPPATPTLTPPLTQSMNPKQRQNSQNQLNRALNATPKLAEIKRSGRNIS